MVAIQRWFYKLIISLALTREFKTDQSNLAFWNGKWYGLGKFFLLAKSSDLVIR